MPAFAVLLLLATVPTAQSTRTGADSLRADREIVETATRHASTVRSCYETEGLRRNPTLRGTLELRLTIQATGTVSAVETAGRKLRGEGASEVALCVATRAKHWRFARGPYVVETITIPFVLQTADSAPAAPVVRPSARQ